jgi:hypothetical protein
MDLPDIPLLDLRQNGITWLDDERRRRALDLRQACLKFFPGGSFFADIADPLVRNWMRRSGTPYFGDIAKVAGDLGVNSIWTLHGAYVFGCTAMSDEQGGAPRLRRTLDWPFEGLGHLVEVTNLRGPAGDYYNVGWPCLVASFTGMAPGRFAVSINQAPFRGRTGLTWLDKALAAVATLPEHDRLPPEHLLRQVFEECATYDEAVDRLAKTPLARPALFIVAGTKTGERLLIEREERVARVFPEDEAVANAFCRMPKGWQPRDCGPGTPIENNLMRMASMNGHRNGPLDEAWVIPPVANYETRLEVDCCPATGRLWVTGWEKIKDEDSSEPVTKRLTIS